MTIRSALPHGVLVSGSSTGIGRACVLDLARAGVRTFAGVRRLADGERLRDEAEGQLVPVPLDVTDPDSIAAAVVAITSDDGDARLSGLVNNAGVAVAGPLEFLPIDDVRRQFETNVVGALALTQACLPLLRAAGGRIVNVSSISGRFASPLQGAYASSKFALEGMSDALRRELAPWGILVSLVEPGRVSTPIWRKASEAADAMLASLPEEALSYYGAAIAHARDRAATNDRAGIAADEVARITTLALTAARPRTRYLVGRDARIGAALARLLPDTLLDAFVRRRLSPPPTA